MSMDIPIWSQHPPELPSTLPQRDHWKKIETPKASWYEYVTDEWMLTVEGEEGTPDPALESVLPNPSWRTYLSLSPIGANEEGYDFLEVVTRGLCKSCEGYWQHPGNGQFYRHDEGPF